MICNRDTLRDLHHWLQEQRPPHYRSAETAAHLAALAALISNDVVVGMTRAEAVGVAACIEVGGEDPPDDFRQEADDAWRIKDEINAALGAPR